MSVPELQRLQQGDPAAWNHAFDLLWPEAFHVARRRLARWSAEDAEDVAVEALGDAAGMVGRVAGFEELRALVRVLAHRRAVDLVRSREALMRREPLGEPTSTRPDAEPTDDRPEPWEQADALDVARWLSEAVERLRPVERALLAGHYVEGRTHAELAALHGVSRATLGVRLARILMKLRRHLSSQPGLLQEVQFRHVQP